MHEGMGMQDGERRFRALYVTHGPDVLAYALRRVVVAEDAVDVVAETFLVAWRRVLELPPDGEARLWLFGVARRVLANHHRAGSRQDRLGERLRSQLGRRYAEPDLAEEVVGASAVRQALSRLTELDREVLTLAVWEDLTPREIAAVLDLDAVVVRARLSRARSRMRAETTRADHALSRTGHVRRVMTTNGEEAR
jgi:RNA polymerase sigma factor (sigma-70 family)